MTCIFLCDQIIHTYECITYGFSWAWISHISNRELYDFLGCNAVLSGRLNILLTQFRSHVSDNNISFKFFMWEFQKRDSKLPSWICEATSTCVANFQYEGACCCCWVPRRSKDSAPSPHLLLAGMIKWATSGKGRKGYKSYSLVTAVWDRDGEINCGARNRKIKMKPLLLL